MFSALTPGSNVYTETDAVITVFHCVHGHSNEILLKKTAKAIGMELIEKLKPCTGCSMAKCCRKPVANSTKSHATEKLGRVSVDLRGLKRTRSSLGNRYVMLVKGGYSRHAWAHFLKHKSDSGNAFRKFLADTLADGTPSNVAIVRSDNGVEFYNGKFGDVCKHFCNKHSLPPSVQRRRVL